MSIFNYNSFNPEEDIPSSNDKYTPVLALKELVASLHREQKKIQDLLSSLSFALRSFNNLNQFLELIPLMVARVTDAEGGALILYNKKNQVNLEQIYCHNHESREQILLSFQSTVKEINSYYRRHKRNPQKYPLNESFPVFVENKFEQKFGSWLKVFSCPILIKNVEEGRLFVFSKDHDYSSNNTRRKLAQLVADQTSVAIANHRLTVKLRSKERQDRELEIASEIQLQLLPRKFPQIKGLDVAAKCQTANRVGGDYYDFIPMNYDQWDHSSHHKKEAPNQPWSIVIGDVMGKGVPAGLIMTMTRGMLRAEVLNRHSPSRVLSHLNRVMFADLENSHRFVTLFYSEYDPQTNILRFANAAHNPPLLWREGESHLIRLDTDGMLIGLQPNSAYQEDALQLRINDTILYYTDGLTDAVNQNNQRFDEDNLVACFEVACRRFQRSEDILNYIFREIKKFIGYGQTNNDDITLIVIKYHPKIATIPEQN